MHQNSFHQAGGDPFAAGGPCACLRSGRGAMTKVYFEEWMQQSGRQAVDNVAFGVLDGIGYSVELEGFKNPSVFRIRFVLAESAVSLLAELREHPVEHIKWRAAGTVLEGMAAPPDDFYAKATLHSALSAVQKAASEVGALPPGECPLCGKGGCNVYAWLQEGYRPAHGACLQTRLHLPEADSKTPQRARGNVATGVLGALVGALVGALPVWTWVMSRGTVNAIFYAFITVFSALLYRLFRGSARRNLAGGIVAGVSLLTALALEQLWFWMSLPGILGYVPSIVESFRLYWEGHTLASSVREMFFCLLFLIAGFFPASILLRWYVGVPKVQRGVIRGAAFVRASAAPAQRPQKQGDEADNTIPAEGPPSNRPEQQEKESE